MLESSLNELHHDKTIKVACAPSEDWGLCTKWVVKDPSFLNADIKDSDQTVQMPRLI